MTDIQNFHTVAWHEGRCAYNNGVKECWNPYAYLTDDHNQWGAGWHWAQDEDPDFLDHPAMDQE